MTTISSMARNTYTMYKMVSGSTASSSSASTSDNADVSSLANLVSAFSNSYSTQKKTTAAQDSLTSLWSGYTSSVNTSSGLSSLSTLSGISTSASALVSSYNDAKKMFQTEFDSAMSDLKVSANTVATMTYNFSSSDITTAADGTTVYSDSLKEAISNVKQLVSDYNNALSTTSDYSSVSKRMKSLAGTFADTTYRSDTYQQIGIIVSSTTGELSVDEDKLAAALTTSSSRVENALGSNGLAGKAENHASFAISQRDKVFPSMQTMLGSQLTLAAAYTNPKVLSASVQYGMIGNLLNMSL